MKTKALYICLLIMVALFSEGISLLSYRILFKEWYHPEQIRIYRDEVLASSLKNTQSFKAVDLLLHPYNGYVFNNQKGFPPHYKTSASAFGFGGSEPLLRNTFEGYFTVAVVGGSVA